MAQRAERPYLEITCLAHLGIAGPDAGGSVLDGGTTPGRRWTGPKRSAG